MTQVTFYTLEEAPDEKTSDNSMASSDRALLACMLAAKYYRAKNRCVVICATQKEAEEFDELLWQRPMDAFVPHNLSGEGPANGAPVEISWKALEDTVKPFSRPILINLSESLPKDGQKFRQIVDFVPASEHAKQGARDRYKQYRASGFQMNTEAASSINEIQNG